MSEVPLWTLAVPNACAGILAEQLITGTAEDIWGCLTDNGDIRGKTRQCIKAALQVIGYGKAVKVALKGVRGRGRGGDDSIGGVKFADSGAGGQTLRSTTIDGVSIRVKSGHAYRADHPGSTIDVTTVGTRDELDAAVAVDLAARVNQGASIVNAGAGYSAFTVTVNGTVIEYRAVYVPSSASYDVATYYALP